MTWRASAETALRRLAAITITGTVLGLLVGGVGGRLAMMLLAALNPESNGVPSDDGFRMGQFTAAGTAQLLGTSWQLGLLGAFAYACLRGLLLGPGWFRVLSMALGTGVVAGALTVSTTGVDFTLLRPLWLTVGLFVALPLVYAGLLAVVAEHWIRRAGWPAQGSFRGVLATLLLWIPVLPVLFVLAAVWTVSEWLRRRPGLPVLVRSSLCWLARAGLAVVLVLAAAGLVRDVRLLS